MKIIAYFDIINLKLIYNLHKITNNNIKFTKIILKNFNKGEKNED